MPQCVRGAELDISSLDLMMSAAGHEQDDPAGPLKIVRGQVHVVALDEG